MAEPRFVSAFLHDDAPELLRIRSSLRGDVVVSELSGPLARANNGDLLLACRRNVLIRAVTGDRMPCIIVVYA